MAKLPWFKFYAQDWTGSGRVRGLSGDQMAAYVWLLCEQWVYGHLPFDVTQVTPKIPKGISDTAVAFVLTQFFPPDPDTNLRRNPKLAEQQELLEAKQRAKSAAAGKAREAKARKYRERKQLPTSVSSPVSSGRSQKTEAKKTDVDADTRIPHSLWLAGLPYFQDPKTRTARVGEVQMLLEGMRGSKLSPQAVERGLADMVVTGAQFTPVAVKRFAERAVKLLDGENAQQAVREALAGGSSVSSQPDANQAPSEDDFE